MDRNIQKIGLTNLATMLLTGIALIFLSQHAGSAGGQLGVAFIAMGVLVSAVSYFQMRLETRERLEKLEYEELKKAPAGAALFTEAAETFPAKRSREQFDKYFVPTFTFLLFVLQATGVFYGWKWLSDVAAPSQEQSTIAMALFAMAALILFLVGKYSAGIARLENQPLLRPSASYMLLGALTITLVSGAEAAVWFGYPKADAILARILVAILGLVAVENLFSLVFEIYRPRVKQQAVRVLYESRLIGLLGQPGGLITTAAQALDYQFGFQVSHTWFYRFLEKALAWIVLAQLSALFLSTAFVIIQPGEQAVIERFGKQVAGREVLEPGLHFKLPWPFEAVYRFKTREIQTFSIGFVPDPELDKENVVLWTRAHAKEEFNMLVASRERSGQVVTNADLESLAVPVNLLAVSIPVQYQVDDVRAWMYNHTDSSALLESLATREVIKYLVSVDVDDIMTIGRKKASEELRLRIQKLASEQNLGAKILYVGLQGVHPPVKVADAYEAVIGSLSEKETNILAAEAYALETVPRAAAEAIAIVNRAEGDRVARIASAGALSSQFTNQMAAYQASPSVYKARAYLDTLGRSLQNTRKVLTMATNTHDVIQLNLEEKFDRSMLQLK